MIEQWVTAQCELYLLLSLIFATVMGFGCSLLSITIGMHGGYFWRIMEADHA